MEILECNQNYSCTCDECIQIEIVLALGLPLVQTWWRRKDHLWRYWLWGVHWCPWSLLVGGMAIWHDTRSQDARVRSQDITANFDSNPPWASPAWNMPDGMALLCASPWFLIGILLLTSKFYEALVTHALHNSIFEALCWMGVYHFVLSGSNSILKLL